MSEGIISQDGRHYKSSISVSFPQLADGGGEDTGDMPQDGGAALDGAYLKRREAARLESGPGARALAGHDAVTRRAQPKELRRKSPRRGIPWRMNPTRRTRPRVGPWPTSCCGGMEAGRDRGRVDHG